MDRTPSHRPPERPHTQTSQAPTPPTYPPPFQTHAAQPPMQMPFSDPFQTNRDPFLHSSHSRRGSIGVSSRAWPPTQGMFQAKEPHTKAFPQRRSESTPGWLVKLQMSIITQMAGQELHVCKLLPDAYAATRRLLGFGSIQVPGACA